MANKAKAKTKKAARRAFPEWAVWAIVGAVLILAVTAFFLARDYQAKAESQLVLGIPSEVGADEAFILWNRDALLVDLRPANEWVAYHVEGSISIPLDELPGRLDEIPTDSLIVVIDRTGELSPQGRDLLLENGYARVTAVTGGIQEWIARGYPVIGTVPY